MIFFKTRFWLVEIFLWFTFLLSQSQAQIVVFTPINETITNQNTISFEGKVFEQKAVMVLIGSLPAVVDLNGHFSGLASLKFGKNSVKVNLVDKEGREKAETAIKILCLRTFRDLTEDYWSKKSIEYLATLAIIKGDAAGNFRPNNSITRAELMEIMARLNHQPKESGRKVTFSDLSLQHWAYEGITQAVDANLVNGYPDGTFRPDHTITRLEALAMIVRFAGLPEATKEKPFYEDLPANNWAYDYVMAARQAGWLNYLKSSWLGPFDNISRGEAVGLLAETKYGTKLIRNLLDFTVGYALPQAKMYSK